MFKSAYKLGIMTGFCITVQACGYQSGTRDSYQVKTSSEDASSSDATTSLQVTIKRPWDAGQKLSASGPMNAFFLKITPQSGCPDDHYSVIGWFPENQATMAFSVSTECSFQAWLSFGYQSFVETQGNSLAATIGDGLEQVYYKEEKALNISKSTLQENKSVNLIFRLGLTPEGKAQGYSTAWIFSNSENTTPSKKENEPVTFDQVASLLTTAGKGNCARAGCHTDGAGIGRLATYEDFKGAANKLVKRVYEQKSMPPKQSDLSDQERLLIKTWVEGGALPGILNEQTEPTGQQDEADSSDTPEDEAEAQEEEDDARDLTRFADVEALFLEPGKGDCARAGCHATGGSLRPLTNFEEIKAAGRAILTRVVDLRNMPPNAAELSDAGRSLIKQWLGDGSLP